MQVSDFIFDKENFDAQCAELSNEFVFKGPHSVKGISPRLDGQSVQSDGHEHVKSHLSEVQPQMEFAYTFNIPDTTYLEQPHLRAAAAYVASFHGNPHALHMERERKMKLLLDAAQQFAASNAAAHSHASSIALPIAKRFNVVLLQLMVQSSGYSDTELPFDIIQGVPNFGDIPASESHAPCEVPQTLAELDPFYARKLIGSIRRKAQRANSVQRRGFNECYQKTMDECAQGWMLGHSDGRGFTKQEMDTMCPHGWHPSERFAQYRYDGSPCRPCDNFRTSGVNAFNSYHERLTCENAGFPAQCGEAFL